MATQVTINNTTFNIPSQGASPPWGDDLSSAVIALATALGGINGSSDIGLTSFTIANNQVAAASVLGASFDTSTVRSAIISYSLYRSSSTTEMSECGQIFITYKSTAATWEIARVGVGDTSVTFTITAGGQLQYVSSNFGGINYSGKLKFSAKSFLQA